MLNIESIFSLLFNLIFDIRDSIENNEATSIDKSTITLVCVADNSLSMSTINNYCKNLEIIYGAYIRSLLSLSTRTRLSSSSKSIFRSLPLLTPYDLVKVNKSMDAFESARNAILTDAQSSSAMVSHFAEEAKRELELVYSKMNSTVSTNASFEETFNNFSVEANDAFLNESRGGVPTFVNADLVISALGKTVEKRVSIGIRVVPKLVDKEWIQSFFIKRGKLAVNVKKDSFFAKIKSKLRVNKGRIKNINMPLTQKKDLVQMMDSVESINKPFVCLLMSNNTAQMLSGAGLKVMSPDVLKSIYKRYPVMSIGVINTALDTINVSLTRDSTTIVQTLAEFNSEVATYEKELAELVRSNSRF